MPASRRPRCFCCLLAIVTALAGAHAAKAVTDYPITPVPFTAVRVGDEFWTPRLETNRTVTVWYDFKKCEETGRIDNFAKAGGLMQGPFRGIPFDDSDVYKVIEGACYTLAIRPDAKLDKYLDALIAKIAAAQEPDGYLYTARRLLPPEKMPGMSGKARWHNEESSHELYNVGHLYEAAVAHFQATGKRALLEVAIKNANLLVQTFGPGKIAYPSGHQEIEIGLVKLYRTTGDRRYLDLARFLIDQRGRRAGHRLYGVNAQDHRPLAEQDEAVGHAVRAGYFYSGAADVAAMTGDAGYIQAVDRIWENMAFKKLYLTGGVGARHAGEAFGNNYELPNASAYNETCAAIANGLWNYRMFLLHGDAKYLDVLERVLYNGFLSGVSLSGDRFFYPNPLEAGPRGWQRQAWFGCSCCPVNVVRFVPSIPGYVYATRGDALFVNLFIAGQGQVPLGGRKIVVTQETRYPWDGQVKVTVAPEGRGEFELRVRIPGWAQGRPVPSDLYHYSSTPEKPQPDMKTVSLKVNGQPVALNLDHGFACIRRDWRQGDTVDLSLPMLTRRVVAHELVKADADRVAIERGPIVYCAERADNPKALGVVLEDDARFTVRHEPQLLGGVTVLQTTAQHVVKDAAERTVLAPTPLVLIPYFAWANRAPGEMAVWFARSAETAIAAAENGVVYVKGTKITASFVTPAPTDHLVALCDGREPRASNDHGVPRFTWWPQRSGTEWVQYDFKAARKVSSAAVYWFDDTGTGDCRVPKSWRLLYKSDGQWKPVEGVSDYGRQRDTYNRVHFSTVETSALRLEMQLQRSMSAGILEWKVD